MELITFALGIFVFSGILLFIYAYTNGLLKNKK